MPEIPAHPAATEQLLRRYGILFSAAAAVVVIVSIGSLGGGSGLVAVGVCVNRLAWTLPAFAIVGTGLGLARLLRPLLRLPTGTPELESALGLAILLTAGHLLGQLGLLHGDLGFGTTLALTTIGLGWLAFSKIRENRDRERVPAPSLSKPEVAALMVYRIGYGAIVGVLVLAAVSPPGALWGSEFGGYDALSYHLQLPQEWLARGRIESLDHNVYSFLPSFVESAFVYLAALTRAPLTPEFPGGPVGLLAGSGWRAVSCQALHAAFLLQFVHIAIALCARCASLCATSLASATHQASSTTSPIDPLKLQITALIGLLVLCTPWSIVVGTLAYNEMPMLALFAGALLASLNHEMSPAKRGVISGILVAAACGVKPTAFLFVGLPTGIVLLGTMPVRDWWRAVLPGVAAALAFLAPWMIRNTMASGNPVFPFALTNWLGTAHWDAEQLHRFLQHHVSREPLAEKLKLLLFPDPNDPAATPGHPVFRGMSHPQWGVFFALAAMAVGHCVFWLRGRARLIAVLLSVSLLIQVLLWLFTTHVQSRFLLPLMVPCLALVAMATEVPKGPALHQLSRRAMNITCWMALLAQGCFLAFTITSQHEGHPAVLLPLEPADFTATAWRLETDPSRRDALVANSPTIAVGVLVPAGERIVLLGEAAPFYYPPNVIYNTVWDRWPFKDGTLADTSARFVLVDFGSIARFERSGYLPPSVTLRGVEDWVSHSCRVVREWREQGKVLVEVIR